MHEFEVIERFFRRKGGEGVALGIGDDGAVLDVPSDRQLVAAVDTLVAGVHFPEQMNAADIGYRALAVNLSDIAAMGAKPAWMTLALTLPTIDPAWLERFATGLFEAAEEFSVALVGGDTTAGDQLVISVHLLGLASEDRYLTRSGCRVADRLYISGAPGEAAAGLKLLQHGDADHPLAQRFSRPTPRVALGQAVNGIANAAIDVSDGLCADLMHMLTASGCGATLAAECLPLSADFIEYCGADEAMRLALTGGDDYELLLSVSEEKEDDLRQAAKRCGVPLTRIGHVHGGSDLQVTRDGKPVGMDLGGYRHFVGQ